MYVYRRSAAAATANNSSWKRSGDPARQTRRKVPTRTLSRTQATGRPTAQRDLFMIERMEREGLASSPGADGREAIARRIAEQGGSGLPGRLSGPPADLLRGDILLVRGDPP